MSTHVTIAAGDCAGGMKQPIGSLQPASLTPSVATLLELLPTATLLIEPTGYIRLANAAARDLGIMRRRTLAVPELRQLVRDARRLGESRQTQISIVSDRFPRRTIYAGARAEPMSTGDVALVVIDLTEASRVESVRRDFVANVGHEIKTPVGALTLLTEAALQAQDDPVATRRFLKRLHHEVQRLSRLVQDLLDLSRLQGGEPLPEPTMVSLDAVVDEALDRARLTAESRGIRLVRRGARGMSVQGSEQQLVTAVANLLDNAVAYSGDGTLVDVAVELDQGVVSITIRDEGIGIAAEDVDRIFERFYRADPARSRATGGTGLGLSIVKHVVSNHGGDISVRSAPNQGSTFTIRLPVARVPARPAEAAP